MSWTPTTVTILDGDGATKTVEAYTDGTNVAFANSILDALGAVVSPATSALQTAGNSSLATIATNAALSATAAKQDTGNTALGTPADAAVTNPASSTSIIGALKGMLTNLATIASSLASIASLPRTRIRHHLNACPRYRLHRRPLFRRELLRRGQRLDHLQRRLYRHHPRCGRGSDRAPCRRDEGEQLRHHGHGDLRKLEIRLTLN